MCAILANKNHTMEAKYDIKGNSHIPQRKIAAPHSDLFVLKHLNYLFLHETIALSFLFMQIRKWTYINQQNTIDNGPPAGNTKHSRNYKYLHSFWS